MQKNKGALIVIVILALLFICFYGQPRQGRQAASTTPLAVNDITMVNISITNTPPEFYEQPISGNITYRPLIWGIIMAELWGSSQYTFFDVVYDFDTDKWETSTDYEPAIQSKPLSLIFTRNFNNYYGAPNFCLQLGDYIDIKHNLGSTRIYLPDRCYGLSLFQLWVADDGSTYYDKALTSLAKAAEAQEICNSNWQCGVWSACSNNIQTRICTDSNGCETAKTESKSCTCTPNVQCGIWSTCTNNIQVRICADLNKCIGNATETQSCTLSSCPITASSQCTTCEITKQAKDEWVGGNCLLAVYSQCSTYLEANYPDEYSDFSDGVCGNLNEECPIPSPYTCAICEDIKYVLDTWQQNSNICSADLVTNCNAGLSAYELSDYNADQLCGNEPCYSLINNQCTMQTPCPAYCESTPSCYYTLDECLGQMECTSDDDCPQPDCGTIADCAGITVHCINNGCATEYTACSDGTQIGECSEILTGHKCTCTTEACASAELISDIACSAECIESAKSYDECRQCVCSGGKMICPTVDCPECANWYQGNCIDKPSFCEYFVFIKPYLGKYEKSYCGIALAGIVAILLLLILIFKGRR